MHLIDGTYELFRLYYGAPGSIKNGREVGATRAMLRSFSALLSKPEVTHVAGAFDTVIESFRNEMFDAYKTGEGIEPELWAQFPLAERVTHALGITVWSMIDFEADDGIAAGVAKYADDPRVERIVICSPDKDLGQMVRGTRVVMWDRRADKIIDEEGVKEKFGVPPAAIPDYLALVGDTADGIPGIPRWGKKSAGLVLSEYGFVENIPDDANEWTVKVRGATALADNLAAMREEVALYKKLAILRTDVPLTESLDDIEWKGARRAELEALCSEVGDEIPSRITKWREPD